MIEEKPPHYKTTPAPDAQYTAMKLQSGEVMYSWLTPEQMTGYLLGNVIECLARFNCKAPGKGGLPDLLRAQDCLRQLILWEGRE